VKTKALKLLFVVPGFPRISETFVTDQIIGLHDLGHQIDVFTTCPGNLDDPGLRQDLADAVGSLFLPPQTPRDAGLAWLPQRRWPNWFAPRTWQRLLRVLTHPEFRQLRYPLRRGAPLLSAPTYDTIVCHFGPAGAMLQQMRAIGLIDAPLITIFHGYDLTNYLEDQPADVYQQLFAHGDLFLPISEHWRQRLEDLACPPERTRLQRLGTDLETFEHAVRCPQSGEELRLLSVARLVAKKGLEFGIRAVGHLTAAGTDVQYDIVGDGPLRDELTALVTQLDLGDRVRFLGPRSHAEVARIMPQHHILLVPSVTDADGGMEGIPVVIMEAMATGLLVVASRHSGIPEIVQHQHNGLLATEGDDAELAARIADISQDAPRWQRLVITARDTVHQQYDLRRQNKELLRIIRELIAS